MSVSKDTLFEAKLCDQIAEDLNKREEQIQKFIEWFENEPPNMVYYIERERQRCYLKAIEIFKYKPKKFRVKIRGNSFV